MKKILSLLVLSMTILAACSSQDTASTKDETSASKAKNEQVEKAKPEQIQSQDYDKNGGADGYANAGDNKKSRYYVNPDFYNMKTDENLTIIPKFKTFIQTTEWSCGPATTLMVLHHFGKTDVTEMDIAKGMKAMTDLDVADAKPGSANNFYEYGSDVKRIYNYLNQVDGIKVVETSYKESYTKKDLLSEKSGSSPADAGNLKPTFSSNSLYASENSDTTDKYVEDAKDSYFVKWVTGHIKAGRPIMVEWGDWDGHWQAIIGYDNNGTPGIGDDILVFADPYDTSDHWQDGYYYYPLERWFYMWKDRNIAPKPYQIQPYIVVDSVK
ncbi:C39 family peptidase [Bacillus rubiinfantis]|uniref:C39 family peptidase n=1 Tax=Bacillus rubiinfantis TaxID=1499680 RepID=UPI0005A6AD8E|nr:C39 family peptidase [Bacillus rubiinfantis]